jgi:hypothetical protein
MGEHELWVESYQGEVLGETLFGLMAEREDDADRRHQLEVLTLLERATKELAEPVFDRRSMDRGDTAASVATATSIAESLMDVSWNDFLSSFAAVTAEFLEKYRQLVVLADNDADREVAEAYVSHEEALAAFARRALGEEAGEPLERILSLPHVAATTAV